MNLNVFLYFYEFFVKYLIQNVGKKVLLKAWFIKNSIKFVTVFCPKYGLHFGPTIRSKIVKKFW